MRMRSVMTFICVIPLYLICSLTATASEPTALEIFDQRITPIFRSHDPSSCVQCHLASVDLKHYILPSAEATFVSLRDQGLIDLDNPSESKILELIRMGERDLDEGARLIQEKMRRSELDAFTAWLEACGKDERLRSLPKAAKLARPSVPDEVIRHARKSRIVDSFVRNVWSQRMRCFPCHTPHEIDPGNPKHKAAVKTRNKFAEQYDEEMLKRLEIFRETPEATLAYLIESSRKTPSDRLPLIDLESPTDSMLVLKPMSKLPKKKDDGTFATPGYLPPNISHMGGLKLHGNDQSYKSIVTWIQDYSNVVDARYEAIDDLPDDNWHPSKLVVRIKAAPEDWKPFDIVQVFVFGRNVADDGWTDEPLAFTQGVVTPRKMVNGALFLLGDHDDGGLKKGGRYLVRAYHDAKKKVASDPTAMLEQEDFFGEAEIPKAKWREGFRFAEVVDGGELTRDE